MSSNRAAVQLLNQVGIPQAVSYAQKLNVGTPPSVPSLALGAGDVTLLSLTAAYGSFANAGIVHAPVFIRRVEDNEGKVLFVDSGKSQRAISESTAFLMSSMLADVINAGTAYKARQSGFTLPAAGKTGTTNDFVDAWFVGFTPHLVAGVWLGFDQPTTIIRNGYAGDLAVPIWSSFMKIATKGDKPDWFDRPANVIGVNVCRVSGKLPNTGCGNVMVTDRDGNLETRSMIYTDYFVKGTPPTTLCPLHEQNLIDALAGAAGVQVGAPVSAEQAAFPPPPPASTSGSAASVPAEPVPSGDTVEQPQKKKRGFWSRIFGGGDDRDKKKKDEKPPKKPGGQ
jgi:penicillin-binding protein 1A